MDDRLSALRNVQTGSGSHPAFYSASGAWSWPLASL